jgi:arabinoxylan arabinofuranohydrolase
MWSPPGDCGPINATCEDPAKSTGENNHQGLVEYPAGSGRLYFAYHSRVLSKSRGEYIGYQRNVAIDRLYARASAATFPLPPGLPWVVDLPGESATGFVPVSATPSWLRQLKYLDAFAAPIPATLSAAMSIGLDSEPCAEGGLNLGFISDGSTTMLRGVNFGAGAGASAITLRVATPLSGVSVSVLVDGRALADGCAVPNTGDWQTWANVSCALAPAAQGVAANLTLRFSCATCTGGLLNLRYFVFSGAGGGGGGGGGDGGGGGGCSRADAPLPAAAAVHGNAGGDDRRIGGARVHGARVLCRAAAGAAVVAGVS